MENKYQILLTIYNLVKGDTDPTVSIVQPNEIIVRQNFAWDETLNHLNQLQLENLILIKHLPATLISITESGFFFASSYVPPVQ